ncbi:ribosome biogenesis ATPase RIX7 [Phellopilus nigrolimitatus]|nr:ribosome biogenesis ATPase RIX7 [Phellopilus nigrolimitatus]
MEISGTNSLNRSMQGLWSNNRRGKVNLNSTVTSLPASPPGTPKAEKPAFSSSFSVEDASAPTASTSAPTAGDTADVLPEAQARPPNSSVKRKLRPSRTIDVEEKKKRYKPSSSSPKDYTPPTTRLSDLGGVEGCVEKMLELVAMPLCHPEVYLHTGVQPPRGVLLHGPPGCGKTLLANAIAGELGVPFISVSAPSIVSGMSGESEKTLRETFDEAKKNAPCLLFIDEIDAITPKRESAQREMERRIVAQFLTCMDDMSWDKTENKPVIVIGATNRPDSLDAALRRAGRFDHEISMGVPDEEARAQILRVLCSKLRLEGSFNFQALANATPGYVGADLAAITGAAGVVAVKRIFQQLSESAVSLLENEPTTQSEDSMAVDASESTVAGIPPDPISGEPLPSKAMPPIFTNLPHTLQSNSIVHFLVAHPSPLTESQLAPLFISFSDFLQALKHVQPSSRREGFTTVPDVTWADIGALHTIREELHMAIVQPIRHPEMFRRVGISAPCGVLLWGPPGCGKTLLAKAVANESRANFISVKGPGYVGESERAVRQVFTRARASSPCVIFFDELDALVPRRDDSLSESSARMVNTLLTELDGLDERRGVYVIAATNRPDMIDPAMCRPGRLDKLLYVDLPSADERAEIIRTVTRGVPLGDVLGSGDTHVRERIEVLVRERGEGFSGADLSALVREAGVIALRRALGAFDLAEEGENEGKDLADVRVTPDDFEAALDKLGPSVSVAQRRKYSALRSKFAGMSLRFTKDNEPEDGRAATIPM